MIAAFLTGFFLGISLILAIGAQNVFVLRQGILGQHVFYVALFCAISDTLLICIGIVGISFFLDSLVSQNLNVLFGLSALWLMGYGLMRLKEVFKSKTQIEIEIETSSSKDLISTIGILAILTFLNPHVYLDTIILIGSISQQFTEKYKIAFALGASFSSFVFFFSLAYGAKLFKPLMQSNVSWRLLDFFIAIIMFTIAIKLAYAGEWF